MRRRGQNPFWNYLSKEQREHARLCRWLKLDAKTKNWLWWHTPNESKKTPFERFLVSIMGNKKGVSDFIFAEPRGAFVGLVIELKKTGERVYKKNGECYFPEQERFLIDMRARGWRAEFAVGEEDAKALILDYHKLEPK